MIDHARAGQRFDEERHRLMPDDRIGAALDVRLRPPDLRRHVRRIEHEPGAIADQRGVDVLAFGRGPAVHPDDRGRQRLAVGVGGDAAVELPADRHAADIAGLDSGIREGLGDGRTERRQPERGILLGPARPRIARLIGRRAGAAEPQRVVDDDGLETLGADVDAKVHRRSYAAFRPQRNRRGPP